MVVITIAPKSDAADNGNCENGCNGDESVGSGMIVTNGDPNGVTTSDKDTVTVTAGIQGWPILLSIPDSCKTPPSHPYSRLQLPSSTRYPPSRFSARIGKWQYVGMNDRHEWVTLETDLIHFGTSS